MAEDGFSISSFLQDAAKKTEATRLAKKTKKQGKKEGIFGGLMALLKPAAGFLSKAALTALKFTNPYLLPLAVGLGTSGFSKIFETVGRKNLKLGADPSKIVSESELGYGKETAKTIREGLETSISSRDPFSTENIIGDIGTSYISALTPKIVPGEDGGWTVEGGELGKTIETDLSKLKDLKLPKGLKIPKGFKIPGTDVYFDPTKKIAADVIDSSTYSKDYIRDYLQKNMSEEQYSTIKELGRQSEAGWVDPFDMPSDDFKQYLKDSSSFTPVSDFFGMFKKKAPRYKYYGGGSVEGGGTTPTIADYFSGQGVSLGGSNEKSLAEMLGRK